MRKWMVILAAVAIVGLILGLGVKKAMAQTPTPTPQAPVPMPWKWFGWGFGKGCNPNSIAEALGMSTDDLVKALQEGKTIAQLAEEKGVALSTIVDQCLQFEKDWLSFLVQKGYITQEMADKWLSLKRQMLEFQFTYNWRFGWGWGRMRGPRGKGPRW